MSIFKKKKRKQAPAIEEAINDILRDDALNNALDFAAFLRTNDFLPVWHDSGDGWSIMRADEGIGFIVVNRVEKWGIKPRSWTVFFNSCDFDGDAPANDDLKEIAWTHLNICGHYLSGGKRCGCGNQPGRRDTIFGKECEHLCHSPLAFTNPDAQTVEHMKKLMLLLKKN